MENWISVGEAQGAILAQVRAIDETLLVPVAEALMRVNGEDVVAPFDVPGHDNSAMDGFACLFDDVSDAARELRVAGASFAGHPFAGAVCAGECVQVMTGARLPQGTEIVIPQEETEVLEAGADSKPQRVRILENARRKRGQHLRFAGEDIRAGAVALPRGQLCYPAEVGLLASLGLAQVRVVRPLRVAFFSTGDEIRSIGEPLGSSDVYDSNRHTLRAMVQRMGFEAIDGGIVKDDRAALAAAIDEATAAADVVLTSGGASVGAADFIREVLTERGQMHFWKVAMRPGRPLTFGTINDTPFFGLPGNPVSVMVCFYQFVQAALWQRAGRTQRATAAPLATAIARTDLRKVAGRTEYQRGWVSQDDDGEFYVSATGDQGSGILSSMTHANCFIVLPAETTTIAAGDRVQIQLFEGLV